MDSNRPLYLANHWSLEYATVVLLTDTLSHHALAEITIALEHEGVEIEALAQVADSGSCSA